MKDYSKNSDEEDSIPSRGGGYIPPSVECIPVLQMALIPQPLPPNLIPLAKYSAT